MPRMEVKSMQGRKKLKKKKPKEEDE